MAATATPPPELGTTVTFGCFTFDCKFDSGNFAEVVQVKDNEFEVYTRPDCAGTEFETKFRTWFHFSVRGGKQGMVIRLNIRGMNAQPGLYRQDYRPFVKCIPSNPKWERLKDPVIVPPKLKSDFGFNFKYKFEANNDTVYFAFCYPYSYTECQKRIDRLGTELARRPDIYYQRELLVNSLLGRRIDLLTVTSSAGASSESEPALAEGLFPEKGERPLQFPSKRFFFISARVHPGETPAQFMMDGFIDFITRRDDPRAQLLRDMFVFKIVPMLNPDGVANGHYRSDTRGVNLNRMYIAPDLAVHPAVYGVRQVVLQLASTGRLSYYIDLHAHATKRGCFFFGNAIEDLERQVDNLLFARVCAINSSHVDFPACNFTEKNMKTKDRHDSATSKEGSGRVALYRATGLTHFYTVECNYNRGRSVCARPAATGGMNSRYANHRLNDVDSGRASPPTVRGAGIPFTIDMFEQMGSAIAVSALDMEEKNMWSRIPNSEFGSLAVLRRHMAAVVRADRGLIPAADAKPPPPVKPTMKRSTSAPVAAMRRLSVNKKAAAR